MIEGAQRIFDYLPISFRNETEQEYVTFLWETFVTNYENEKYHFAFLGYHMLFMSFVYFEIWQIKANYSGDFEKAMVGFNRDMESVLMKATTPYTLWNVRESGVFRFLKLIGMTNADIGECTRIVKDRNDAAHSNGNIFYRSQRDIDTKIEEILQCVEKIQTHSERVIESCYRSFLIESADLDARENLDDEDQIREILVYGNYLSPRDIQYLKDYDCKELMGGNKDQNIIGLIDKLQEMYPFDE